MRTNIDEGISTKELKPSILLERKQKLLEKLEEAEYNFAKEKYETKTLKFMLERLQGK